MMKFTRFELPAALFLTLAVMLPAEAQSLSIGDPAPKLEVKSFVKGEPVKTFEPGKLYVVEFWATWCGPCKATIPHLTELQKKNPGVAFIGVSILEQQPEGVKPFVDEMGDKMAYRVAIDAVDEKAEADQGAMAKNWMKAAGQNGIPAAFIVNGSGQVAWIGHPMEMDKPLQKIMSGTWDLKAAREELRKGAQTGAAPRKVAGKFNSALRSGDPRKLVAAVDDLVADDAAEEASVFTYKLSALIKLDEQDKAFDYAQRLAKSELGRTPQGLNELAWTIIDPEAGIKPNAKLVEFALETARRADAQSGGKDPMIADTLAKAFFDKGDVARAIETEERGLRLVKEAGQGENQDMKNRLERYRKAAK